MLTRRPAHLLRDVGWQARDEHIPKLVCPRQRVVVQRQRSGDVARHDVVGKDVKLVVGLLVPAA